jgi:glycosyltransferase involved in cell wall biosynthesis
VPSLRAGDAVGGHTLRVRDVLVGMGLESEIFVETAQPEVRHHTLPVDDYLDHVPLRGRRRQGVMYQMAIGSRTADIVYALPERTVVDYHNVTPASFFFDWDGSEVARTDVGRWQMHRLAERTELGLADSAFNEQELVDAGYRETAVVPILLDVAELDTEPDRSTAGALARGRDGGGADLLFVGRLAPHKAQHDLVKALAVYRRLYDPLARLHLVGSAGPTEYVDAVRGLAERLGLSAAVTVAPSVTGAQLAAYYRAADVFVSVSEHEGFCIPVLEAMHHGMPVVAFAAGAVPETVGDAGLVLHAKDPLTVAVALDRVLRDGPLREGLVAAGRRRLAAFDPARTRARLEETVTRFVEAGT